MRETGPSAIRWASSLALSLLCATAQGSTSDGPTRSEVTAAYLFNFSKFVEWPEGAFSGPTDPIAICVLGEGAFGKLLGEVVKGKRVNGREIVVREVPSASTAAGCHVVFVAASDREALDATLGRLAGRPVLTVSDARSGAERGAVIGLMLEERRVRFEVNLAAADRAGLKLSSQLLKVAVRLIGQREPGSAEP